MNKRMYKKVTSLYREGVSSLVVTKLLIDLAKNSSEAAEKVDQFWNEEVLRPIQNKLAMEKYNGGAN